MKYDRIIKMTILIFCIGFSHLLSAQSLGSLDTSFNQTGKKIIHYNLGSTPPTGEGTEEGRALHVYSDNSMLIAGYAKLSNVQDIDMVVTKLDKFGNIDTSFGNSGQVVVAFDNGGDNQDILNDIVVYPDGRILLIGAAQSVRGDFDFAVARLHANGSFDTTFAGDGKRTFIMEDGGSDNDFAISAILVPSGTTNQPDIIIIGNVEQNVGVHIGAIKISEFGAELFFANQRFNLNIADNRITGALAIVKGDIVFNSYWILGYADEGFNSGTSPYLIRITETGEIPVIPNVGSNHFVAIDNRNTTSISGVAQVPNSDKFVFVGVDTHAGTDFEDCAVMFVDSGEFASSNVPFSGEFNFELNAINNTPCTNAAFTNTGELILSGDIYPDDLSDTDMALFKLNNIDVVNNGSGTNTSFSIDNDFGFQGGMTIFFDTGGNNTSNRDNSHTLKIGADGHIIVVGSAMFDGTKKRTAVAKVINNDVIFENGFE